MDEFLRQFDMKILKGMIAKGKDAEDIRRYARARYKDEEITHEDLEEIDELIEARDNPPISEPISEEMSAEEQLSSDESEVE